MVSAFETQALLEDTVEMRKPWFLKAEPKLKGAVFFWESETSGHLDSSPLKNTRSEKGSLVMIKTIGKKTCLLCKLSTIKTIFDQTELLCSRSHERNCSK